MIYNIQTLRAMAALLVVLTHLDAMFVAAGLPRGLIDFGTAGVDIFFTISGFVMIYATHGRRIAGLQFMKDRVIRVVPLYWMLTLALFVFVLVSPNLLGSTKPNIVHLLKSLFFVPFVKGDYEIQPILFLGLTLNYEMFFYAIFACLIVLKSSVLRALALTLIMIALAGWGVAVAKNEVIAFFYTRPIILEFAAGAWIAVLHLRGARMARPIAIAGLILGTAILIGRFFVWPEGERAAWSGVSSAVILAAIVSLPQVNNRHLQLLGAASYSLYLIHPFVIIPVTKVSAKFGLLDHSVGLFVSASLAVILSCAVAVLMYRYLESPVTRFLKIRFSPRRVVGQGEGVTGQVAQAPRP